MSIFETTWEVAACPGCGFRRKVKIVRRTGGGAESVRGGSNLCRACAAEARWAHYAALAAKWADRYRTLQAKHAAASAKRRSK
jgi:hypothetical protein